MKIIKWAAAAAVPPGRAAMGGTAGSMPLPATRTTTHAAPAAYAAAQAAASGAKTGQPRHSGMSGLADANVAGDLEEPSRRAISGPLTPVIGGTHGHFRSRWHQTVL